MQWGGLDQTGGAKLCRAYRGGEGKVSCSGNWHTVKSTCRGICRISSQTLRYDWTADRGTVVCGPDCDGFICEGGAADSAANQELNVLESLTIRYYIVNVGDLKRVDFADIQCARIADYEIIARIDCATAR